ncbi:hypothetical protein A3H89_04975 [Candidatus Amesbacteria bacterium RIFCSPLOWO2_02_FULL_48_11]|uniref:Ribokinase n=4 Tax=Candidatus Amesiibacteriota TaxID=1752730 RepID=A0A0G1WQB7_9BACT|nr:MAG: Ribokinase [Candidatus Amesbacteria bacterium GW2011_GWA2_47_11]KKU92543.1 MAG: Ribokinase [Candidatus Amesbacteria bacterium GW2011_GWC1_48_10]KKU99672.1 MAG: Ribokinase [Candidatus Amesbacteria bacterium GW2011_GWA1_48_9]OGC91096.1 MAG: hypothetical protein A2V48_05005 [Candidatus Amesbacteria bacterium RBG_19FT_COMBO_48_16]OGC97368.1 MAG: hypothetical protein A3C34_04670 [Candidatus Amesbacteria bacterium RIFCSPHIGHO2_02_FULL_48_21]OGD00662.1 MAG: hypothetical protein A2702_00605 [C
MKTAARSDVIVLGGLTMDLTYFVKQWPKVNEAVQASSYELCPGGKGFNQATAVKRSGGIVNFIGSIGNDNFSKQIIGNLKKEGINADGIINYKDIRTDLIGIIVDPSGTPGFIGIRQSTYQLTPNIIETKISLIKNAKVLLVNSEVRLETVIQALTIAKTSGLITVYNPAPPEKLPENIYKLIDYFTPNIWEARMISGMNNASASELATHFKNKGTGTALITTGRDGCVVASDRGLKSYMAFPINEVDETGAGDTFCGYFAYHLSKKEPLEECIRIASAAGALACTKVGGRSAPTASELKGFLAKNKGRLL